jgi:LmbE family N-acetylglucosaminyl deacetylase
MQTSADSPTIVFAVCHPDDEALWVGGLISALSKSALASVSVVCLSGADRSSPRPSEFEAARVTAGYSAGVIIGGPLRSALEPLPDTGSSLEEGLRRLGIAATDVDLLVTHSPFGDEHKNPHHRQAHRELRDWARRRDVPFGFFSCLPIPLFTHTPLLTGMRRQDQLHLLNLSKCEASSSTWKRRLDGSYRDYPQPPAFYLQFQTDPAAKKAMLDCYRSIDLPAHEAGYAAFNAFCESIYLMDARSLLAFESIIERMPYPGEHDLFDLGSVTDRLIAGLGRLYAKVRQR